MNKHIITILLAFFCITNGFSQQYPQYSHYMFNKAGYNPGYYGMDGLICANIISRDQWLGWENAPATRLLNLDMPISIFGPDQGIGLSIYSDNQGFEKNFSAKFGYSYHLSLGSAGTIGIGADAGIFNKAIDGEWDYPEQPEDLFNEIKQKLILDVGAGVFYSYENLYAGLSAMHLNRGNLVYSPTGDFQMQPHFIFTGGYNIQLANALIDLTPSFIIKSDLKAVPQFDINLFLLYNKKIWGGVTYRNNDAVVFLAGGTIFNIKLGVSYDLTISSLQRVSNGTFEVFIGYCFDIVKPVDVKQYRSVRFL